MDEEYDGGEYHISSMSHSKNLELKTNNLGTLEWLFFILHHTMFSEDKNLL